MDSNVERSSIRSQRQAENPLDRIAAAKLAHGAAQLAEGRWAENTPQLHPCRDLGPGIQHCVEVGRMVYDYPVGVDSDERAEILDPAEQVYRLAVAIRQVDVSVGHAAFSTGGTMRAVVEAK